MTIGQILKVLPSSLSDILIIEEENDLNLECECFETTGDIEEVVIILMNDFQNLSLKNNALSQVERLVKAYEFMRQCRAIMGADAARSIFLLKEFYNDFPKLYETLEIFVWEDGR